MEERIVRILYRNWKGEVAWRKIRPLVEGFVFGANEWHKEPQWLMEAFDLEKGQYRTFALVGVLSWLPGDVPLPELVPTVGSLFPPEEGGKQ